MTKSTVYIKEESARILVGDMKEGVLYRVDDSETMWDLDIVIISGDILVNLSCLTCHPKTIDSCCDISVREWPKGSSITLTQE
jgi:hypothetical protein